MELLAMRVFRRPVTCIIALAGASTLLGGLVATVPQAWADPNLRDQITATEQQLDDLNQRVDVAVERYDEAQAATAAAEVEAAAALTRVTAAEEQLAGVQHQLGVIMATAYRNGGSGEIAPLMLADNVTDYLARASYVDQLARGRAEALAAVTVARHRLVDERAAADAAVNRQRTVTADLARARDAIEADLGRQHGMLADLQTKQAEVERVALARAAAARRAADDAAAARADAQARVAATSRQATADRAGRMTGGQQAPAGTAPAVGASGGAGGAVATAYAELGKPYAYGAGGPDAFDCSGLTSFAWRAGGVGLSHFTGAQWGQGAHVARGAEQPGDLVFFGRDLHHVGIYIGSGQMIHAPHSGEVVRIAPAFTGDYVGAVRPG